MKAKILIKKLSQVNPDAEVLIGCKNGEPVLFLESLVDNKEIVWLESESDIDLGTELEARFENAAETQMDELDFYMDLLEIGITIDMVRKYMGEDVAKHMKTFCEEHGLI